MLPLTKQGVWVNNQISPRGQWLIIRESDQMDLFKTLVGKAKYKSEGRWFKSQPRSFPWEISVKIYFYNHTIVQCVPYIKYRLSNSLNILNSYKDCLEDNNYESLRSQGDMLLESQAQIHEPTGSIGYICTIILP